MSKFHFLRKAALLKSAKPVILDQMANNAVYHFKVTNFDAAGFVDNGVKKWAPIKNGNGRQPLVKTGRMRESITILRRSVNARVVGSVVPYASYQNDGTKNLPQRKFIGDSKQLGNKNKRVLIDAIKKIVG
jgi:phage gpG-like protein